MTYRGGKIPSGLPTKLRKLLIDLDELAVKGQDKPTQRPNVVVQPTPVTPSPGGQPTNQPNLIFSRDNTGGAVITTIPVAPAGTLRLTQYTGMPEIRRGGNIQLAGPPFTPDVSEAVALISDGSRWIEVARGPGAETFVPARRYGAVPDTGTDMTNKIQRAFDKCPLGYTLVFETGTYHISNTVSLTRAINVYAYGAIFDLGANVPFTTFSPGIPDTYPDPAVAVREIGTLENKAAMIWGGIPQINKCYVAGLTVTRTAANNTAAARLYSGIAIQGTIECNLEDCTATNFLLGLSLSADTGIYHNTIEQLKTNNCRFHITLYTSGASGFVNHNKFRNCRSAITGAISGDGSYIKEQWEHLRLLWQSTAVNGGPNGNFFEHMNLEGGLGVFTGRKVRCEGQLNTFSECRYENQPAATQITIGEISRANGNFSRNKFMGGYDLHLITGNDRIEFLNSGTIANSGNTFLGHDANLLCARVLGGAPKTTGWRFQTTSSTGAVSGVLTNLSKEVLRAYAVLSAPFSAQGSFEFLDTGEVQRNILGMDPASPYDLRTLAGVNVGNAFRARPSGTDALLQNPQPGGNTIANVQTGIWRFYSSTSGDNEVVQIADASQVPRMVLQAGTGDFTGDTGVIKWFDTDGTTVRNYLYQNTSLLPAAGTFKPLTVRNGLRVNAAQANADTQMSSVGQIQMFYLDASTDRIGIGGTVTPQKTLEVVGAERISFSTAANDFTDFTQLDRTGFYGGLAIEPAVNSTVLKWIHLFGQSEATALSILDDGADFYFRTSLARGITFNIPDGQQIRMWSNFSSILEMMGPTGVTGAANFFVPSVYKLSDATTNTILTPLIIQRNVTGGVGANGIGARITWSAENTAGTATGMSEWDVVFDTATAGSEDSSIRLVLKTAGATNELVRFDGGNQRVEIKAIDASTSGLIEMLRIQRESTGTVGNTFGAYMSWRFETDVDQVFVEAGRIGCRWEDAAGAEDSSLMFHIQEAGTLKELMRLITADGATPELIIHNNNFTVPQTRLFRDGAAIFNEQGNDADFRVEGDTDVNLIFGDASTDRVGIGLNSPSQKLEVAGNARADMVLVDSDPGGVASTIGIVNSIAAVSGATSALLATTGGGPAGATQSHWLKFYDGVTARYIPVWS